MKQALRVIAILSFVLALSQCKKKDPIIPNEAEIITTLIYTFIPINGGQEVAFKFTDLDGDGGAAPVIETGILEANVAYVTVIELLNETQTPPIDVTKEIEQEPETHQFFYKTTVPGMQITYADEDQNKFPIGILTQVKAVNRGSGEITITLRHEPKKHAFGVALGDITNAGGETDIEVTFFVDVQ